MPDSYPAAVKTMEMQEFISGRSELRNSGSSDLLIGLTGVNNVYK